MTKTSVMRAAGTFILAASLLTAGGCGYKDLPVAPDTVVPEPVTDLMYSITDEGMQLTWSYPVKTIQGAAISDISSFELYRAEVPFDEYCGGCPIPFGKPMTVEGGVPFDGKVRKKAVFDATELKSGSKYYYKVKSRTSWLAASGDSNIVTFVWYQPAMAPAGLTTKAGDRVVSLNWQPVTKLSNGAMLRQPVQYQIMRGVAGGALSKIGKPVSVTTYSDKQVRNGIKYRYAVQSLMVLGDEFVEGKMSDEITAAPKDMTPPVAPSGVSAVATSVGTKIFWDKVGDSDIGGYRIYRRAADKDNYERIGEVKPEYVLFVDKDVSGDVRYYYAVTAIDRSNPPNESIKSREATIRY